jgi:8-oxo-dGTP diphosphatase
LHWQEVSLSDPAPQLPYKIATLLYCFNEQDEVLLLRRALEPNRGLWSPCGGKLETGRGESPHQCAIREAEEELGIVIGNGDLHLTGMITETGYAGQAHWLMFLFEVTKKIEKAPQAHREGSFRFFARAEIAALDLPRTDAEQIWPLFWKHRGGFFAAHCLSRAKGADEWTLDESCPAKV